MSLPFEFKLDDKNKDCNLSSFSLSLALLVIESSSEIGTVLFKTENCVVLSDIPVIDECSDSGSLAEMFNEILSGIKVNSLLSSRVEPVHWPRSCILYQ